jgi:sulfur carrier protein
LNLLQLTVNGDGREARDGITLADLVTELGLDVRKVAVEHNLEIAPRGDYADTVLADGDRIEIVAFVGGG